MPDIAKLLMLAGVALFLLGLAVFALSRLGFGHLPGDIEYQGRNVRFYFPIVTCILLSIAITALFWLWNWLTRK
jgi:hypothetical protein